MVCFCGKLIGAPCRLGRTKLILLAFLSTTVLYTSYFQKWPSTNVKTEIVSKRITSVTMTLAEKLKRPGTSPRDFSLIKKQTEGPKRQNSQFTLHDASREIFLDITAGDLGIAPSQRSKFTALCPSLTPINFCAEHFRIAQLKLCNSTHECRDTSPNHQSIITKSSVESVIRNGLGLLQVDSQKTGSSTYFFENEMTFKPLSSQALVSSAFSSSKTTDDDHRNSTNSQPSPTLLPPGSLNVLENTEVFAAYNPDTFFESRSPQQTTVESRDRKIILWYAPTRYWPKTRGLLPLRGCPDFPCYVTREKKWVKKSSAMIFASDVAPQWPPERRSDQVFVLQNHEPPNRNFMQSLSPEWTSAFNWTMTYRHDSDIVRPYGLIRRKSDNEITGHDPVRFKRHGDIFRNKTKLVAAMISNCGASSLRDDYIRELSRHVPVDVYGQCGNFSCPRGEDNRCFQEISATYKFFLAFESSMCEDYITEKFFRYFNMDLIVVARGSNQYYVHAPKETFINTADFRTPEELAYYLKYLDRRPEKYLKILQTKSQYAALYQDWPSIDQSGQITYRHYAFDVLPVCQICQRVWNLDKYAKVIPDITG